MFSLTDRPRRSNRAFVGLAMLLICATYGRAGVAQTVCKPGSDDAYAFSAKDKTAINIELAPREQGTYRFDWPSHSAKVDSALLFLTWRSQGLAPVTVKVTNGASTSVQTFPPGAGGTKAVNVSLFTKRAATEEIVVTLSHASLASPAATLKMFSNKLPLAKPLLVLAPHPDDAEVAAFGLYAGRNSTVVTITSGSGGEFTYCQAEPDPAAHYRLKGELRTIDSVTVPWQGGVPVMRAFNLGYFDGRLRAMYQSPTVPAKELFVDNDDVWPYRRMNQAALLPIVKRKATWVNLVADLRRLLQKVRPAIIVTPDPRIDDHPDHQMTTIALWQALRATALTPTVLLYANHADGDRFPYGPSGDDMPPVPWCGPPLAVVGFYAHPLDRALQKRKLLALESMHDLRLPPAGQYDFHAPADERCQTRPGSFLSDDTYFRRAVRMHEVFFTTNRVGLRALVESVAQ